MVQHARLIFYTLLLLVIPCESTLAQKIPVTPIDSLITVGYATGSLKTPLRFRREDYGDTDE